MEHSGQCSCGSTRFSVEGKPIVRFFCHCLICQEFNNSAYSDVAIFFTKNVEFTDRESADFKKYKVPPAVDRGICKACGQPAIEFFEVPLFPALTIIPSNNLPKDALSDPVAHIFYHRRITDIDDTLPKYSGYFLSQWLLAKKLALHYFLRMKVF